MTQGLAIFIERYKDLIREEKFEEIYDKLKYFHAEVASSTPMVPKFTWEMLQVGVNPLDYLTEIPDLYAFDLKRLKQVTIPDHITRVGGSAFRLSGVEELIFPDSVQIIGSHTASECPKLKRVVFGTGLSRLGAFAFGGCSKLAGVEYEGTTAQWLNLKSIDMISPDWCRGIPAEVVKCSNGNVPIK